MSSDLRRHLAAAMRAAVAADLRGIGLDPATLQVALRKSKARQSLNPAEAETLAAFQAIGGKRCTR